MEPAAMRQRDAPDAQVDPCGEAARVDRGDQSSIRVEREHTIECRAGVGRGPDGRIDVRIRGDPADSTRS
jgi:hypothetical protein